MYLITHHALQDGKYSITRAMAGVELCLRIGVRQPVRKFFKFGFALMIVEQMESSDNCTNRERTGSKDVFQPAVSTSREQQTICIQSQLVSEIILNVLSLPILDEKMPVSFRHRMNLRYVCYDIDVIANASAMLNRQQSLSGNLWPSSCYAMQMPSF